MFCEKCGCRIPGKASKCPGCGADLPGMEYCSGFWAELNQNSLVNNSFGNEEEQNTRESHVNEETTPTKETGISDSRLKKGISIKGNMRQAIPFTLLKYAAIAECVIILILLIFNGVSGSALKKEISQLSEDCDQLESQLAATEKRTKDQIDKLSSQNESTKTEHEELQEKYDSLLKEFDEVREERDQLEKELNSLGYADPNQETSIPGKETTGDSTGYSEPGGNKSKGENRHSTGDSSPETAPLMAIMNEALRGVLNNKQW